MNFDEVPFQYMIFDLTSVLMGSAYIDEKGNVIHTRAQVWRTDRWVAYVYSETQHRNPHFHVRCTNGRECSYDFLGNVLAGKLGPKRAQDRT